jgi:hypothetical protein
VGRKRRTLRGYRRRGTRIGAGLPPVRHLEWPHGSRLPPCAHARVSWPVIDRERLAASLGELDAGTRALLDLSLRRAIPDDQVAKALGVDAASIPPRRARGIGELADRMEVPGPSELAALLIAIPDLPDHAWDVPTVAMPSAPAITSAARAHAFRRAAVAASPLVALGAVIAALAVSTGSETTVHGVPAGASLGSGSAPGAPAPAQAPAAVAPTPDARHGLPRGAQLASVEDHKVKRHARRQHRRSHHHHAPGSSEHAILTRAQKPAARHSQPVAFHPAPVTHNAPKTHKHRHSPSKPKAAPKPAPNTPQPDKAPAIQTPVPVSTDSPTGSLPVKPKQTPSAPVSAKPPKPPVPQPDLSPHGDDLGESGGGQHGHGSGSGSGGGDDGGGGGCDGGGDASVQPPQSQAQEQEQQSQDQEQARSAGAGFTPPGLFKKRVGPGSR